MGILSVQGISKRFGNKQILDNLSFNVEEHSIYGFIGKNGAGKTTTMKLILGLYQADGGKIMVNGEQVVYGQNRTNKYIGYLPDVPEFYNYMTPEEYLKLCADITGISSNEAKKRIPVMLEMVGLDNEKRRIQGFSRGMKQRLGIAQALLPKPKLLICDEPTSALDPVGRKEILDIIKVVTDETTVIFSTHILHDVERICDNIGILHEGKLAWEGDMEAVHGLNRGQGFVIEFFNEIDKEIFSKLWEDNKPLYREKKSDIKKIISNENVSRNRNDSDIKETTSDINQLIYENGSDDDMRKAMQIVISKDIKIKKIEMQESTLENVFMEVLKR